METWKEIYSKS